MKTATALPAPALSYKPRVKKHLIRGIIYLTSDKFSTFVGVIAGKGDSPVEIQIEADLDAIERTFEPTTEEAAEKAESTFAGLTLEEVQDFEHNRANPTTDNETER